MIVKSLIYSEDPASIRRGLTECYDSAWPQYVEIRYCDPVDWSWDEHRWLFDPLYRSAVTFLLRTIHLYALTHGGDQ